MQCTLYIHLHIFKKIFFSHPSLVCKSPGPRLEHQIKPLLFRSIDFCWFGLRKRRICQQRFPPMAPRCHFLTSYFPSRIFSEIPVGVICVYEGFRVLSPRICYLSIAAPRFFQFFFLALNFFCIYDVDVKVLVQMSGMRKSASSGYIEVFAEQLMLSSSQLNCVSNKFYIR